MGNAPPPEEDEVPAHPPINLMRGWPNPDLLPSTLIRQAATAALSDPSIATDGLLYGPDPGYQPCREAIAQWLTTFYNPPQSISPERLCITGGASQNLGCVLSVYTDPEYTRNIWIVAPAYMLAFRVFEDAGFSGKMRAVPEDEQGIDLTYLRQELEKSEQDAKKRAEDRPRFKPERKRAKVYKHMIYCVPTFANPSSRTMSLQHRKELVRIAQEYDALVVADDVYDFLQWPASEASGQSLDPMSSAHLPRLVDIDRSLFDSTGWKDADGFGNTCSNGSFSKIVGPGVRVGWCEGTEKFAYGLSQCGTTASGGAPSQLTSTYVTQLLTSGGLEKHIQKTLRPAYLRRYNSLMSAIRTHLIPLGFSLPQPSREIVGGYFVWLALPSKLSANTVAKRCKDEGNVIVAPGIIFEVPGDKTSAGFDRHVRLCFAWEKEEHLAEGVEEMARIAKEMLENDSDGRRGGEDGGGFETFK